MFPSIEAGQKATEEFYNKWVAEVKATVPSDRLLVFSVKEGWEPLCKFLELPIPEGEPFPRVNDTKAMSAMVKQFTIVSHLVVFGFPLLAVGAAVAYQYWGPIQEFMKSYFG